MSVIYDIMVSDMKYNVSIDEYIKKCKETKLVEDEYLEWLSLVADKLGIVQRGTFMSPDEYINMISLPTHKKFSIYKEESKKLVYENLDNLFSSSSIDKFKVNHIITVSCSGVFTPGLEHCVIDYLGLAPNTWSMGINFMGCHGAMKGLYVANQLVEASKEKEIYVLVICVELCSLHLKKSTSKTTLLANSLFSDGCVSCIIGSPIEKKIKSDDIKYEGMFLMNHFNTIKVPNTRDMITWDLGETSFDMFMDRNVHTSIGSYVKPLLEKMPSDTDYNDITYCIHPGGITILEAIKNVLGLSTEKLEYSYEILKYRGNMSSCTILYVLDLIRNKDKSYKNIAMIGAGPGISLEFCYLTPLNYKQSSNFVYNVPQIIKTNNMSLYKKISIISKPYMYLAKHYIIFIIILIIVIYFFMTRRW